MIFDMGVGMLESVFKFLKVVDEMIVVIISEFIFIIDVYVVIKLVVFYFVLVLVCFIINKMFFDKEGNEMYE